MNKLQSFFLFTFFSFLPLSLQGSIFECCYSQDVCGPLVPCGLSLQVKGGWAPTHYTSQGPIWLTDPIARPPIVYTLFNNPRFKDQFNSPWEVGGEVAWNASEHVQFFAEGVYLKASGRTYSVSASGFNANITTSDYETYGGYIGSRYYFNQMWCLFSPFVGGKFGILEQSKVNYSLSLGEFFLQKSIYYQSQWVPSGGIQIGFDTAISDCLTIVFTAEAIVTQGLKNERNSEIVNPAIVAGLTNVSVGETGKLVSFPITLGLKYNF